MKSLHLQDVLVAQSRLRTHVQPIPLVRYPLLNARLGTDAVVKHGEQHAIRSFKARGALNAILATTGPIDGVVASSSGNHGQGVAYAASTLDLPAVIFVPEWSNPEKLAVIRALGADVKMLPGGASDANAAARQYADKYGWLMVDDFSDLLVMAGAGTLALEMMLDQPDLGAVFIPVGGGALAAGCGTAIKGINPGTRVIGVQPESAPATYESWKEGRPVDIEANTIADGLAVNLPESDAVEILRDVVDEMVLVSEDDLLDATKMYLSYAHVLVEPSAAASLAGFVAMKQELDAQPVGLLVTGSNITAEVLTRALERDLPEEER